MNARQDWLTARKRGIGGSDASAVFNEEYGCARALWFDKRDVPPDYPQELNGPMRLGTALEALVCDLYAERSGRALIEQGAVVHPEHAFMRCNVDRIIAPVPEHDGPGVLEAKTAGSFVFRTFKREGLRSGYVLQIQHNMAVTGLSWGAFVVMSRDSGDLVYFDVERDDALIGSIIEAEARFWRTVEHGPMPDALPEIDRRCKTCPWRRQCRGEALLAASGPLGKEDAGANLEADETLAPLLADYREAERMATMASETLDIIKDAIRDHLGPRPGAVCAEGKVYFREQISMRLDGKALEIAHPEIAKQFKRPSTSRPLRVYAA